MQPKVVSMMFSDVHIVGTIQLLVGGRSNHRGSKNTKVLAASTTNSPLITCPQMPLWIALISPIQGRPSTKKMISEPCTNSLFLDNMLGVSQVTPNCVQGTQPLKVTSKAKSYG